MKRDLDLIRLILTDLEEASPGEIIEDAKYHEKYDGAVVREHMRPLIEGELAKGRIQSDRGKVSYVSLERLTVKGHDFISVAQDDSLWKKAKESILKPGVSFTFDLLLEWLKKKAQEKFGLPF